MHIVMPANLRARFNEFSPYKAITLISLLRPRFQSISGVCASIARACERIETF
jgi:hypothetical protein